MTRVPVRLLSPVPTFHGVVPDGVYQGQQQPDGTWNLYDKGGRTLSWNKAVGSMVVCQLSQDRITTDTD